jgi:hypothetical protein
MQRYGADSQNVPGNIRPLLIIILGAIVFLGGCTAAVIRESLNDRDRRLAVESADILDLVISTYGSEGGPLSLTSFVYQPDLLLNRSELDGSIGRAIISIQGPDIYRLYFPDEESFGSAGTSTSRTTQKVIAVSMGDGRVVPGRLEVTTVG